MYYEEKIINGILHYIGTTTGFYCDYCGALEESECTCNYDD